MNKILVKVLVPKLDTEYEFFIPVNKSVNKVRSLIAKLISDLTDGYFFINDDYLLYDKSTGEQLNHNMLVKEAGLQNGSELILI